MASATVMGFLGAQLPFKKAGTQLGQQNSLVLEMRASLWCLVAALVAGPFSLCLARGKRLRFSEAPRLDDSRAPADQSNLLRGIQWAQNRQQQT